MQTVYADADIDFDGIDKLFGEEYTGCYPSLLDGIKMGGKEVKTLIRVEDDFGWDDVVLLPNKKILFPCRNSGISNITSQTIDDVDGFVQKFVAFFEEE